MDLQLEKDVNFCSGGIDEYPRLHALRAGSIDARLFSPPASLLAQDAGYTTLLRTAEHLEDIQASIVATDDRLARQGDLFAVSCARRSKDSVIYLANRQEGITAMMEFTRQKDRDMMSRVYDEHMKTIARDGTIPERLQRIVIDRSKRLTGVTREIPPEEIFDFSYMRGRKPKSVRAAGIRSDTGRFSNPPGQC